MSAVSVPESVATGSAESVRPTENPPLTPVVAVASLSPPRTVPAGCGVDMITSPALFHWIVTVRPLSGVAAALSSVSVPA